MISSSRCGALTKPSTPGGPRRPSVCRPEVEIDGALPNFATVRSPFFNRFAEVESDEDARIRILGRRLGETGIRAEHRCRIAAGAPGRERHATILEADLVAPKHLLQHLRRGSSFDSVTRGV